MNQDAMQLAPPTLESLNAELSIHRQVLQGMAIHLQQLQAQVGEVTNLLDFVVDSLGDTAPLPPAEEPSDAIGNA